MAWVQILTPLPSGRVALGKVFQRSALHELVLTRASSEDCGVN